LHALLAFRVSAEKSAVILMDLPLYVTCYFSLAAFNTISLFCTFNVLTLIWVGVVLSWSVSLLSQKLPIPVWLSLSQDLRIFLLLFYWIWFLFI
jgi:hypothetical protein